jgi:hypothetical protein
MKTHGIQGNTLPVSEQREVAGQKRRLCSSTDRLARSSTAACKVPFING